MFKCKNPDGIKKDLFINMRLSLPEKEMIKSLSKKLKESNSEAVIESVKLRIRLFELFKDGLNDEDKDDIKIVFDEIVKSFK